jgi:hypothetical protein
VLRKVRAVTRSSSAMMVAELSSPSIRRKKDPKSAAAELRVPSSPTRTLDEYVRVIAVQDHVVDGRSRRLSFRRDESFVILASSMENSEWVGVHKGRKGVLDPEAVIELKEM